MKRFLHYAPAKRGSVVTSFRKGVGAVRAIGACLHHAWDKGYGAVRGGHVRSGAAFARALVCSPRMVGAVCPSGRALAEALADRVPAGDGLVVELGAGTGAITRVLLERGISLDRLVAIEKSGPLAKVLHQRFPELTVIRGDASLLATLLPHNRVDCVVSSLPQVSLPPEERAAVLAAVKAVLRDKQKMRFVVPAAMAITPAPAMSDRKGWTFSQTMSSTMAIRLHHHGTLAAVATSPGVAPSAGSSRR